MCARYKYSVYKYSGIRLAQLTLIGMVKKFESALFRSGSFVRILARVSHAKA